MSLARPFEMDSALVTPRQERIAPILAGPATVGGTLGIGVVTTDTTSDNVDVFASFFQQNLSSGSGTIDNLGGSHITSGGFSSMNGSHMVTDLPSNRSSLSESSFSSLLTSGLDHAIFPSSPTQW